MNGPWIKMEKDLLTDPRVFRMATQLCRDAPASQGVTLVLGALAQLWMLADTHIGNDDVMPLGVDEINKFIGLKGFCEILPQDWLQVIDSNNVKLPDYHIHNGTQAKKRALARKRNDRYKIRRNAQASQPRDAQTSLDQDQDLISENLISEINISKKTPLPPCDDLDVTAWAAWLAYRKSIGKSLKPASQPLAQIQLARFGRNQLAVVNQSIAAGWTGLFALKAANGTSAPPPQALRDSAEWSELLSAGLAEGFRNPANLESASEYAEALQRYRNRSGPKIDTTAITAKLRAP